MTFLVLISIAVFVSLLTFFIFSKCKIPLSEFVIGLGLLVTLIAVPYFILTSLDIGDAEIRSSTVANKGSYNRSCSESYPCNCSMDSEGNMSCDTCWRHWNVTTWKAYSEHEELIYSEGNCYNNRPTPSARFKKIIIGEPTAKKYKYTNYIRANKDSIINRLETDKQFVIPSYPETYDYYRVERVLVSGGVPINIHRFDNKLDSLNSRLRHKANVNVIIIVTDEVDQKFVEQLRNEWVGGKKNDFIVVIGTPNYPKISWANVMSWTDATDAVAYTKNRIASLDEFNEDSILEIIEEEVTEKYTEKDIEDFAYLQTNRLREKHEFPMLIYTVLLTLAVNAFLYFYDFDY